MKRHNIALLVANINDGYSKALAKGAMDAAKRLDVNLVIIPGNYVGIQSINEKYDKHYDYQYNVLFDYALHADFDYLIAAIGTITYGCSAARKREFISQFKDLPLLVLSDDDTEHETIGFNNATGILAAVKYLVNQGRKHIAFMAGNQENSDCRERTEAFRRGLEENGVAIEERLIQPCDGGYDCLTDIEKLIDNNPDIDAIMCVNDVVASVVYEVLTDRRIEIGKDVAVIGFDDQPLSRELDPPLATIRADASLLGAKAVEKAVSVLIGAPPRDMSVETRFIPRHSCFADVRFFRTTDLFDGETQEVKAAMKSYLAALVPDITEEDPLVKVMTECVEQLDNRFIQGVATEDTVHSTYELLRRLTPTDLRRAAELCRMYALHEILYIWLIRRCRSENINLVRDLYHSIDIKLRRRYAHALSAAPDRSQLETLFIRDTVIGGANLRDSYAEVLRRLCNIGVSTSYLYVLDHPIIHNYGFEFPDDITWLFKSYAYGSSVYSVPENEQKMYTPEVFRNPSLVSDRPRVLVATVLYSAEVQYGLALFEPEDADFFREFELVTYQLSSAVRTLDILRELNDHMNDISYRYSELEDETRKDELTRVLNRRGFYAAAQELMDRHPEGDFIVCYADTKDLRRINQFHGHIEGDFAIKMTSDCLRHVFGRSAVIGRLGGGEFAVIVHHSHILSIDDLIHRKDKFINEFNHSKLKPYTYNISTGILEVTCVTHEDLEMALEKSCEMILGDQ
ncbi:MAG: GGDEF domain-containing protein [Oscillospiraceae bacterium]|nr:GGDEF domain-containing protein [Oscillospiraceae bacterium]